MKSTIKDVKEVLGTSVQKVEIALPAHSLIQRNPAIIGGFRTIRKHCAIEAIDNLIKIVYETYASFAAYSNLIEDNVLLDEYTHPTDEVYAHWILVFPEDKTGREQVSLHANHVYEASQTIDQIQVTLTVTREVAYVLYKLQKTLSRLKAMAVEGAVGGYSSGLDMSWFNPELMSFDIDALHLALKDIDPFLTFFNELVDTVVEAFFLPNV